MTVACTLAGSLAVAVVGRTQPPSPSPSEMALRTAWARAAFGGEESTPAPVTGLDVLANHGPVQRNGRGARPLHLGKTAYPRGLYCHAPSRVMVRLPGPGMRFEALVGVDTNDQTSGGRGSVVFVVRLDDREAFRSELLREGMEPQRVSLLLGRAESLVLEVEDGGDGIACDQADWVDARVVLQHGRTIRLGDLPLYDSTKAPFPTEPPFSFRYGSRSSRDLLPHWSVERARREIADPRHGPRLEHTLTHTDPETGLVVRCVGIEYLDFPTVEWTLSFRNAGQADTPILADICAVDVRLNRGIAGEFTLHRIRGDDCTPSSYQPLADPLPPDATIRAANSGGRPTQGAFPYFNVEWATEGVICALGWPGQWAVDFARDSAPGLAVRGGQELTHFTLHPGEEVRSPLVVLQFHQGDWLRAQNIWRRWMLAHNTPQPGGQPVPPLRSLCTGNYYPGLMTEAAQERAFLERHLAERVGFDLWWQDAGWYPCDGVGWPKVGTWEVDPVRFPAGLRELSDLVHTHGKRAIVWFEPERVHPGTWLAQNHPEWVHGGAAGGLLKLGEPACREWLTDHIGRLLTEQGIDFYRQDFNIDPLPYWRAADTEDRQGIAEIRHVEGYLAYWDELLRRHPDMLIDSCASGGRRNDLETLRRAVPLLRSDWYWSPEGQQCLTHGLSLWIPYHGTGVIYGKDAYWWRSSMVAELSFGPDAAGLDHVDFDLVRRIVDEHRQIAPYLLGDFYPLTAYSQADDVWAVWQFHRADLDAGIVRAFRRTASPYESARFRLQGLDPSGTYAVTRLDRPGSSTFSGQDAMEDGVPLTIAEQPGCAVITYRRRGG